MAPDPGEHERPFGNPKLETMHNQVAPTLTHKSSNQAPRTQHFCLVAFLISLSLGTTLLASENVPHRPFAQWADLPERGQFVFGLVYQESEAYRIWAGRDSHNITVKAGGESYGIDINQGYVALQYGITEKWAADFNIGGTTMGWRSFDPKNAVHSTIGLMDWSFGALSNLL